MATTDGVSDDDGEGTGATSTHVPAMATTEGVSDDDGEGTGATSPTRRGRRVDAEDPFYPSPPPVLETPAAATPTGSDGVNDSDAEVSAAPPRGASSTSRCPRTLRGYGSSTSCASCRVMSPPRYCAHQVLDVRPGIVDEMSSNLKELSAKSTEMTKHLMRLSAQADKVIEDMATYQKTSLKADHLKSLSSQAEKMLEIRIECKAKRDLVEERRQKVIEDMATYLEDISKTSLKADHLKSLSSLAEKDGANFLKTCQSLLSDFVFFMLSLIPWLLYKNEESPSAEYYPLLFFVTALACLGMTGYVLSHIARRNGWIITVYAITSIAVMATIALVGYALFKLIPSDYEHYGTAGVIYLVLYIAVGLVLVTAWFSNFRQAGS